MQELTNCEIDTVGGGMRLQDFDPSIKVGDQRPPTWQGSVNQFTYGLGFFVFADDGSLHPTIVHHDD